ncbi:Tetratricopeptide repeat protein 38 [Phytophthora nicotianae]|uniref:Tetratricopeptide repeat protein 38 n=1 Tax=Phytophthora nicotianae TaxID=4792 RepID=A0A0W8BZY0_PHYNI|nr:Tetratricopeptide repeat protein 38 [Phytophthora nicotianae]
MGKTLDSFCLKRDGGGFVTKAPPCTKADLKKMMVYLYTNSCSESDYQDAALLCLLWYLFGRASDLSMIKKRNISIDAADVFFLRLVRVKTSEEQGLSLPDADFSTCPLLAVALALSVQAAPSPALIDNLPDQVLQTPTSLSPDVPLVELLNAPPSTSGLSTPVPPPPRAGTAPTIYAHVNRVLDRVCPAAASTDTLDSIAGSNGYCSQLATSLRRRPSTSTERFWTFLRLLVRHYPVLKDLNPKSPAVNRLETCVAHAGRTLADLLAWSAHLAKARNPCKESEEPATPPRKRESNSTEPSQEQKIIEHQAAVIKHLIENSKRQDARMDMLEAKINGDPIAAHTKGTDKMKTQQM